jgi:cation diffusion facilitator family transporter
LDKYKTITKILWGILVANIFVSIIKVFVGFIINSASLQADGYHSITDGLNNFVGLIGVKIAAKPADLDHPYGHRKSETIAALFIGFFLIILGINIISGAIGWLINPSTHSITLVSLIAIIFTVLINIAVAYYEYRVGKKLNSEILMSDAKHTRSDILVSVSVLITLFSIKLGAPSIIDPILSIVVALFIFYTAYEILISTSNVLMDKNLLSQEEIKEFILLHFQDVKDVHKVRSRGTLDQIYIDLHILLSGEMSIEASHELIHDIENKMRTEFKQNIDLIAHLEPYDKALINKEIN